MSTFVERYRQTFNKRADSWHSSVIGYPIGRLLAVLVAPVRAISPNDITIAGFALKLAAAALLFWHTPATLVAFVVCMQLTHILDCVDGTVARMRRQFGPLGAFLDKATDQFALFLIGAMVGVRAFEQTGNVWYVVAACAGGAGNLQACYMFWIKQALDKPAPATVAPSETIARVAPTPTWREIGRDWLRAWPKIFLFDEADMYFWVPLLVALGRFDLCAILLGATQMATALVQAIRYGTRLHALGRSQGSGS